MLRAILYIRAQFCQGYAVDILSRGSHKKNSPLNWQTKYGRGVFLNRKHEGIYLFRQKYFRKSRSHYQTKTVGATWQKCFCFDYFMHYQQITVLVCDIWDKADTFEGVLGHTSWAPKAQVSWLPRFLLPAAAQKNQEFYTERWEQYSVEDGAIQISS